ncbi:hypothetical protein J132_09900 [Termitomyces sp. J132]|nr:hypothetical protein J132_09900 [Termitomyces sp. J132]
MSSDAPKPLSYNIAWAQRTFSDRPTTEALLAPERDAGNVSFNDYQAAARFFAGSHRLYRFIGGFLAIPVTFVFRRPSWSPLRTCSFFAASTLCGSFTGHTMAISAHVTFVRSLEDPSGFAQALENIRKDSGVYAPSGPTIVRSGSQWSVNAADPSPIERPSINPPSKWDQIRAVNARTSTNSSWDALRQRHERTRVPSVNSDSDPDAFERSRTEDRVAEQAKFNEMLERERNIKHDS